LRTDLGTTPASEFTSTALNLIPYIAGILPLLLGGVYTLTKRKEKGQSPEENISLSSNDEEKGASQE
ncbi:MAG: hypothetical protein GY855_17455, partial [candidate division Zixibacteria bacterium]|nr:hypothetical protein [candidate division Zixibacteria bacterium]